MALENLSDRDRAVLRSIFDPTATIGDVADDGDKFVEDEEGRWLIKRFDCPVRWANLT